MAGFLIDLEGVDGSGKTTHAKLLGDALKQGGREVVVTKEPFLDLPDLAKEVAGRGKSRFRDVLDAMIDYELAPQTDVFLFAADRAEHVQRIIRPALNAGKIVVTDRYYPSSIIYQSVFGGLDPKWIALVNSFAPKPDLGIVIDLDPQEAVKRIDGQEGRHLARFEVLEKQVQMRQAYLEYAKENNFTIIDGAGTIAQVHERIVEATSKLLLE